MRQLCSPTYKSENEREESVDTKSISYNLLSRGDVYNVVSACPRRVMVALHTVYYINIVLSCVLYMLCILNIVYIEWRFVGVCLLY